MDAYSTQHNPSAGGPMSSGGGMMETNQTQSQSGIAKNMSWKMLFFAAASCVFAAACISLLCLMMTFEWAPFSATSEVFLFIMGIVMIVLDFPVKDPTPHLAMIRNGIYKFMLFMTRFTGRGLWYIFLSTLIYAALADLNGDKGWFWEMLGVVMSSYVFVLGCGATFYGYRLSSKLEAVRSSIRNSQEGSSLKMCPAEGMDENAFVRKALDANQTKFQGDEIAYVINGLKNTPNNDMRISQEDFIGWVGSPDVGANSIAGHMQMV